MQKKRLFLLCIFIYVSMFVIAGNISFQAKYLQETARTLELNMLDTLGSGSKNIINYKGYRVIIIKNDNDVITHIGRHLFAPGQPRIISHPYFLCLEKLISCTSLSL